MIVSFYDREFRGLKNNASLTVDNASYKLVRRAVDLDDFQCTCEAFREDINPTFVIVKNDRGNYVYGALAGIPQLTEENQTKITASDLKTMLKSDVVLDFTQTFSSVDACLEYVFGEWMTQVNQGSISCELELDRAIGTIAWSSLQPSAETEQVYDAWEDVFAPYLKFYGLFMETEIDLVVKRVIFRIGKSMQNPMSIKLWEHGIYDYGKWIADVNETQGCVLNTATHAIAYGMRWILTSESQITTNTALRDIFPIKRKIIFKETQDQEEVAGLLDEANYEACKELAESMFQENIELEGITADFGTRFEIYVNRGEKMYKSLPCGELEYDDAGLKRVQVGYRITGIEFIL